MIVTLLLKPCQRHGIATQFAFYHHEAIFFDGMIVMFVLLRCHQHRSAQNLGFIIITEYFLMKSLLD